MKSVPAVLTIAAVLWSAVSVSGAPRASADDYFFNKIKITLHYAGRYVVGVGVDCYLGNFFAAAVNGDAGIVKRYAF